MKFIENTNFQYEYIDEEISYLKTAMNEVNKSTIDGKDEYSFLQTRLETLELQKKYGVDSWQSTIVEDKLYGIINDINYYKNGLTEYVNTEISLEELQVEHDNIIKKLDAGDWKAFVRDELETAQAELKFTEDSINEENLDTNTLNNFKQQADLLKVDIQVLEWRLEKDICYGDEKFDYILSTYENSGKSIIYNNYSYDINENNYKEKESKDFNYDEKITYQNMLSEFNIARYKIENGMSSEQTVSDSLQGLFSTDGDGLLFLIVISLMLTGTIVSDEFNKGTIKLLLIRPYSRRKVLLSKLIACLITLIISIVIITIIEIIVVGIAYGFDTINVPAVVYNYNTNSVMPINVFGYMLANLLKISPLIIILALVAFMIGALCANTAVAIVVSFMIYFVSQIVNSLAVSLNIKWMKFIPTLNWDLTQYSYGSLPTLEGMTLAFSICICAITIISILVISFENFARKNIKNV